MSTAPNPLPHNPLVRGVALVGATVRGAVQNVGDGIAYVGAITRLLIDVLTRAIAMVLGVHGRRRFDALVRQMIRVGVRSIPIVALVQMFIGVILALNMAPTLEAYGQLERTADIVAIAVFRELGPLFTAILLSGFAGASIAAELGAMVEGEEIKALRAQALDPLRFLVVPRVIATGVMMVGLTVMADLVGVFGGYLCATLKLGLNGALYIDATRAALRLSDYGTGLLKAAVFGLIVAMLACYEGLNVRGGAEGVGRATTTTVVKSIVGLIAADVIFATIFYTLGW